jgi:hypothetical protein
VLVTLDDASFGSGGLATTHWVTLYDADGITLLDRFRYPSDPGDGISLYRVSVTATDSAANWAATPCNATPGAASCPGGGTEVNTYTSFWLDNDASEGGHYWYQAIGWPENGGNCELVLVCTGGSYGYDFRDNFPAPAAFTFRNPYTGYSVTFEERSSATDNCSDDPDNLCAPRVKFGVGPGEEKQVPASSLGFYFATTSGPRLNSLDWFNGDPDRYWALPPDGTLAPFTVEVP